ncbi:sphingomyelin phosphodiesterase, partial [Phenoliferia sp. Uapishka_3]
MKASLLLASALALVPVAYSYNTTLALLLASEVVTDFESASSCDDCLSLLVPIQALANVGDDAFIAVWTTLCTELGLGSAALCAGDLAEQGPILAHSLRSMDLSITRTPTLFCLSIFGLCQYPTVLAHTVKFPKSKSKRSAENLLEARHKDTTSSTKHHGHTSKHQTSSTKHHGHTSKHSTTTTQPHKTAEQTTAHVSVPTKVSKRRAPVQWVHVSDVHIDRFYLPGSSTTCDFGICCRNFGESSIVNVSSPAGPFGNDNCDAPVDLAKSMVSAIERIAPNRVGALFTGDIVEGAVWVTNETEVIGDITAWNEMSIPTYPAVGNHDSSPVNSFPRSTSTAGWKAYAWLYELSSQWAPWIGKSASSLAQKNSGSYARVHPGTNLKIISVNTNFWYRQNFWLFDLDYPSWDPNGILQWMVDELQAAEDAGQLVWISQWFHSHLCSALLTPMGKADTMHDQSNYADQIFQRYKDTIVAMFFGHSHKEQFEIGYSDWSKQSAETATGISFVTGALTPTSGNPVFRVYDVDPDTYEIMDHKSYIEADFAFTANYSSPSFQKDPEWYLYYSARDSYGPMVGLQADEALDPPFWHRLTEHFESNSDAFQLWNTRQSRGGNVDSCTGTCVNTTICDMRASRSENNCDTASEGIAFNKRSLDSSASSVLVKAKDECDHAGIATMFSGIAASITTSNSAAIKKALTGLA